MPTQCIIILTVLSVLFSPSFSVWAEDATRMVPLDEFIQTAAASDTVFEEILIDELRLRYRKALFIPARDLILSIKNQYDFILNQDRNEPETVIGLTKLFPHSGTSVSAEYSTFPTLSSGTNSSELSFSVSQSIARNAFGKGTQLLDKIIGLEIQVARHQIVEAYEDYLAAIIFAYVDWYEFFQKADIAQASYNENVKLLDNLKEREKNKIALAVDVNKIRIQVYEKEESLITITEEYQRRLNTVKTILRYEGNEILIPQNPDSFFTAEYKFEDDFKQFIQQSRTYQVFDVLEKKSSFEIDKNADDLLPSINLFAGLAMDGSRELFHQADNVVFVGVDMEWSFPYQVERAELETSKIQLEKTRLSNTNAHYRLYRDIKNLYLNLKQERNLYDIAQKKNVLAKAVLDDETQNYLYGKITLNDFIRAVNTYDNNRFDIAARDAQIKRLMLERMRILDKLVTRNQINERHKISIQEENN